MSDSHDQDKPWSRLAESNRLPLVGAALGCVLFGVLMTLVIRGLWQLENTPVAGSFKEEMMHRKTRAMAEILEGLVREDLPSVEASAERMRGIGQKVQWYLSSSRYEDNDGVFRDSTHELIEASRRGDYADAKESALRLEMSCIRCHELINREKRPAP